MQKKKKKTRHEDFPFYRPKLLKNLISMCGSKKLRKLSNKGSS